MNGKLTLLIMIAVVSAATLPALRDFVNNLIHRFRDHRTAKAVEFLNHHP